jgi:putative flippase GtrA
MPAAPEKSTHTAWQAVAQPVQRGTAAAWRAVLRVLPEPISRRLQTEAGNRFSRFVPVAIAAVISSQVTLAVLYSLGMTAGKAALCASIVGAGVSYVLSRWAWERKGRPDLLRETVPFWLVSFAVWGILSLTSHYAGAWARHHHLHHLDRVAVVNGAYLAMNCVTFVSRFLIFHYVLFANRGQRRPAGAELPAAEALPGSEEPGRMALAGDPAAQNKQKASG